MNGVSNPLQRLQIALLGVFTLALVALVLRAGLAEGGPWGPFEAVAIATVISVSFVINSLEEYFVFTTAQKGAGLAVLALLVLVFVVAESYTSGRPVSRDLIVALGAGLFVAGVSICWPSLSRGNSK